MIKKLSRYYHTLKHLKPVQIRYQVWYRLRDRFFPVDYPNEISNPGFRELNFGSYPNQHTHFLSSNTFEFLNKKHSFGKKIDWDCMEHGKLWAYHLNYFDYLHQPGMDWDTGKQLMDQFLEDPQIRKEGMEPYPISLRTINWIKFLAVHNRYPQKIVDSLYAQYKVLSQKIEYHLLGNHLLENGFSLLFGAVLFQDQDLERTARKILATELQEQILKDGAHFELSPMYHLILFQRALDGYNLLIHNEHHLQDVEELLKRKIQKMTDWLYTIRFRSGDIPMLNDSVDGQALDPGEILKYAESLGFSRSTVELSECGYRRRIKDSFEIIVDVGEIGPSYQPGHAHSDTLSFVLHHQNRPVIVDRGISTYEKNSLRDAERSTSSHNTVMINHTEQSDVWGGFRVGNRAKPEIIEENEHTIIATHSGYKRIGCSHVRRWEFQDKSLVILDTLAGNIKHAEAFLHFHSDVTIEQISDSDFQVNNLTLKVEGFENIKVGNYLYCNGFNHHREAVRLQITFKTKLITTISE